MIDRKRYKNHVPLSAWIESRITAGDFPGDSKLPPLRELMARFGLTSYAVHQTLLSLQQRGVIELRHGAGAYVAPFRPVTGEAGLVRIVTASRNPELDYLSNALLGAQQRIAEAGYSIELLMRNYMEQHLYEALPDEHPGDSGVLYLGGYDFGGRTLPGVLPAVGLEMSSTCGGRLSPVTLDPLAAAELATDFFRRRGIRRVRAFYADYDPTHTWRYRCFAALWQAEGGELTTRQAIHDRKYDLGDEPGIWLSGSSCVMAMLEQYRGATGRDLRRDRVILGLDGKGLLLPDFPQINTLAVDWCGAGRTAAEELLRRIAAPGEGARRILLPPRLVEMKDNNGF